MKATLLIALLCFTPAFVLGQRTLEAKLQVAIIDKEAFYDPNSGIKLLVDATSSLADFIKPSNQELMDLGATYNKLGAEINDRQKKANLGAEDFGIQKKVDEFKHLEYEIRALQEDARRRYLIRRKELEKPVLAQVQKALLSFISLKGYSLVMEKSQFENGSILVETLEYEPPDITLEFIKFVNKEYVTVSNK